MAGLEVTRDLLQHADAAFELGAKRDVLAERHEMAFGVGPLDGAVGPEQHVEIQRLRAGFRFPCAGASTAALASTQACVRRATSTRWSRRYGSVRGSASMLDSGKTTRSTGIPDPSRELEVAVRQVAGVDLGRCEIAVLVVALEDRDAQRAGGLRGAPRDDRDDRDDHDDADAAPSRSHAVRPTAAPVPGVDERVGEEAR